MRLNGNGALTFEDARTWIEETGLCLFLPRRQFSVGVAPSFVEAIAGERNGTPNPRQVALAEELLVRLETEGVAVRLNLLGQPGEQPDFVVAAWVLPYVYALRGDRDWRRSPQLTGSRQVSPLAIQAYKLLEAGDATIPQLKHTLGREVTETAVLRAITELWQQLRIIPVVSAPGRPAQWQLLRHRFQKAIAEGASTSQVTAISVLASIYLQAVIAASMEEVELFLAPLTARSKVREVLRGLVATRQVHSISFGHAPHFYVAGTLPEFTVVPTVYASSAMAASSYFSSSHDFDDEPVEPRIQALPAPVATPIPPAAPIAARPAAEQPHAPRIAAAHKPVPSSKPATARPHFGRPAAHTRDRKPGQASAGSRPARRPNRDARPSNGSGLRHGGGARWTPSATGIGGHSNGKHNGSRNGAASSNGAHANGNHSNGNGNHANGNRPNGAHTNGAHTNGSHANGSHANGNGSSRTNGRSSARPAARPGTRPARASNGVSGARNGKPSPAARTQRNGHAVKGKTALKPVSSARSAVSRKDVRTDARSSRSPQRKPALTAGAKAGNSKRYGFTAPSKQRTKKRG
jgi:hypothetical protein